MTALTELPELGVGIVYWPELREPLELARQQLNVVEVEPQAFWLRDASSAAGYVPDRRAFELLRGLPLPKIVHGVGFPVGGTVPTSRAELDAFVESICELDGVWASEHLSFNRVRDRGHVRDLGFLLPPLQSRAGVEACLSNIGAVREALPVPFAVETGANYLRMQPGEQQDGEFFAAVSQDADCGLLLDIHNLWTNQRNGRQAVLDTVAQLPLDRVIEVHLAGGQEFDGYWVDAHSGLVPEEVLDLAWQVVPRLPNLKAIVYEVMPEYVTELGITASDLEAQLARMHELWRARGRDLPDDVHPRRRRPTAKAPTVSPAEWEQAVARAVAPLTADGAPPALDLSTDPGTAVLRRLIGGVRAGKVASTLTMTTRLLLLSLGESGTREVFEEFWASEPTRPAASEEAAAFARFVSGHQVSARISVLTDIVQLELAAHRAILTGDAQPLSLSIDPEETLAALRVGTLPPAPRDSAFAVTVTPPPPAGHDVPP